MGWLILLYKDYNGNICIPTEVDEKEAVPKKSLLVTFREQLLFILLKISLIVQRIVGLMIFLLGVLDTIAYWNMRTIYNNLGKNNSQ